MLYSWSEIKNRVKDINNELFNVIETITPSESMKLSLVEYSYGETISDDKHFFLPDKKENKKTSLPSEDFPLAMIMENKCELFLETETNIIPWLILSPGELFPLTRETTPASEFQFHPGSVLTLVSGLRSVTLLPLYSYSEAYWKLQRYYKFSSELNPIDPKHHYKIFSSIAKKEGCKWKSQLLLFDNMWRRKIMYDKNWLPFKEYIIRKSLELNNCKRNMIYLNYAIRDIARTKKFNHKFYTEDMIKQIIFISVSESPGFIPSTTENGFPSQLIIDSIANRCTTLCTPIIMEPSLLNSSNSDHHVYLSITQNLASIADIKSFKPINYLYEIDMYLNLYLESFITNALTKNTIYGKLADSLKIKTFSEKGNFSKNISKAKDIIKHDTRIKYLYDLTEHRITHGLPERSPFLKAFVSIQKY